jgi:hypothetical protein
VEKVEKIQEADKQLIFGNPEEWKDFEQRHLLFFERYPHLRQALHTAFLRQGETAEPIDRFVFFYGRLCCEDFFEILANDRTCSRVLSAKSAHTGSRSRRDSSQSSRLPQKSSVGVLATISKEKSGGGRGALGECVRGEERAWGVGVRAWVDEPYNGALDGT